MSPSLDMRVVLTNPALLDTFSVVRRAETVSAQGLSVLQTSSFPAQRGVVYPAGKQELERLPDEQRQRKTITVITMFALRCASMDGAQQTWQPDIIVWHGNNYTAMAGEDYSSYASGFTLAVCPLADALPTPPITAGS